MRTFGRQDIETFHLLRGISMQGYPSCCGARVLVGFYEFTPQHVKKLSYVVGLNQNFYITCILTTPQNRRWKESLEAIGFTLAERYRNPNSGATLYVYHRLRTPPKPRPRDARGRFSSNPGGRNVNTEVATS